MRFLLSRSAIIGIVALSYSLAVEESAARPVGVRIVSRSAFDVVISLKQFANPFHLFRDAVSPALFREVIRDLMDSVSQKTIQRIAARRRQ
jgi:hypothetical protein